MPQAVREEEETRSSSSHPADVDKYYRAASEAAMRQSKQYKMMHNLERSAKLLSEHCRRLHRDGHL